MRVDFSTIIQNFLTAELGEDVRDSLVAIAQALQDAINAQLLTVDPTLEDDSPNAAAQAQVVGQALGTALKYALFVGEVDGNVRLENQTVHTVCRLHGVYAEDAPDGVDLVNGYAFLYTVGAENGNKQQLLITRNSITDAATNEVWSRFTIGVGSGSYQYRGWMRAAENAIRMAPFNGLKDGQVLCENQAVNTVCRLYKVELPVGQAKLDVPDGVDVIYWGEEEETFHYAWLFTVGGDNRMQYLFYQPTAELFFRSRHQIGTNVFRWTDWASTTDAALTLDSFSGTVYNGTTPDTKLGYQPVNTFCRLYRITNPDGTYIDPANFDQPEGVDLLEHDGQPGYYAWMFTVGGNNKMQYLFDAHTQKLYFRFYRNSSWTGWFDLDKTPKKELKILVIGNSFDQDTFAYLPPILNELLPDYAITYRDLFEGDSGFADHVRMYTQNLPYNIRNSWGPTANHWTRTTPGGTLKDALESEDWDLIFLQGESENVIESSADGVITPASANVQAMIHSARQLIRILQTKCRKPFSTVWFQWTSRNKSVVDSVTGETVASYTAAQMFEKIRDATLQAMQTLGIKDYIPVGAAIQSARTNATLQALGDGGNMLYSDNTHMQAGLPALLAAYTVALKVLEWTGNKSKGVYKSSFVPSDQNCDDINALALRVVIEEGEPVVRVSGMTHGLSALGSDEYETIIVPGDNPGEPDLPINVEKVTPDVVANIYAVQEIAQVAVNNPTVVTDFSLIL